MMKPVTVGWLVVLCCTFAAASAVQDNVLRFLSHKEVVRMAQDTQQKEEQAPISEAVKSVVCPGGQYKCPDGTTCCQRSSGAWACCNHPQAVCCSDHLHCCPNGFKCDVATGMCKHLLNQTSLPWEAKTPAMPSVGSVVCPDDKSQCPDGSTCCKLSSGKYGCCPFENADCCNDGVHCCPHGYTCDVAKQSCTKGGYFVPWEEKLPALQRVEAVVCPDESQCPNDNTCCKLPNDQYGCCPLPDAVCCSDGDHCCPSGYTCDLAKQTCDKDQSSVPLVKVPALVRSLDIVCPDQSSCPSGNTCCKLSTGNYGCCPMPNAVCCSDGVHCCPEGTTCDMAKLTCDTQQYSIPLVKNLPAIHRSLDIVCPDQSSCPSGNTCCKLSTGNYGCCPMPNAVCCSDGVHCCPEGTTCDMAKLTCNTQQYSIPLVKKVSAIHSAQNVVCPDHQSECPSGSTCCKLSTGNYGCCPRPNAVCCSDGVHCCPSGSTCDLAKGTCDTQQYSIPLVKKVSAIHSLP